MDNRFAGLHTSGKTRQRARVEINLTTGGLELTGPEVSEFWPHTAISRSVVDLPDELVLKHGNAYAPDTLNIQPAAPFVAALRAAAPGAAYRPGRLSSLSKVLLAVVLLIVLALAGVLISAGWLIPRILRFAARKVPYSVEQKAGKQLLAALLSGETIDSSRTHQLNGFYRQLNVRTPHQVHLTAVSKPELNAFAVPGGEIVVYTGLLNKVSSPEMLMALLGHEAGHVAGRHSLQSLLREVAFQSLLLIVLNDTNALLAVLLNQASSLRQLAYSRELELAADRYSLRFLQQNGARPEAVLELLKVLQREGRSGTEPPEFLSTHPAPVTRIQALEMLIKELPEQAVTKPAADSVTYYWQRLKGDSSARFESAESILP